MSASIFGVVAAALSLFVSAARGQMVILDFDSAPQHSPLPLDLVADSLTAHFSSSSPVYNYSIQAANVLGFTPVGFSGNCVYPSTVFASDLLISFSSSLTAISILYAPEEYATDSSCTMRITGYQGQTMVATSTATINPPGTWPTGTLSLNSAQPFDNVVIHYDQPPPTGGDYGPIFMADNLVVTPVPEPAPTALVLLVLGAAVGFALRSLLGWGRLVPASDGISELGDEPSPPLKRNDRRTQDHWTV